VSSVTPEMEEKKLGITVHQSLESTSQCVVAAKSTNITLGMISKAFMVKIVRLY